MVDQLSTLKMLEESANSQFLEMIPHILLVQAARKIKAVLNGVGTDFGQLRLKKTTPNGSHYYTTNTLLLKKLVESVFD